MCGRGLLARCGFLSAPCPGRLGSDHLSFKTRLCVEDPMSPRLLTLKPTTSSTSKPPVWSPFPLNPTVTLRCLTSHQQTACQRVLSGDEQPAQRGRDHPGQWGVLNPGQSSTHPLSSTSMAAHMCRGLPHPSSAPTSMLRPGHPPLPALGASGQAHHWTQGVLPHAASCTVPGIWLPPGLPPKSQRSRCSPLNMPLQSQIGGIAGTWPPIHFQTRH